MDIEQEIYRKLTKTPRSTDIQLCRAGETVFFSVAAQDRMEYVRARLAHMEPFYRNQLGIEAFERATHQSPKSFYTYGMVTSATGGGLGAGCLLHNTNDHSNTPVRLNLEAAEGFSLFSGQCVAVRGRNPQGNELIVEKLYTLPILNTYENGRGRLSLVVAHGPFSQDSLERLMKGEPEVLVLFGPFVALGDAASLGSYALFNECLESKLRRNMHTKVVLVPSLDDHIYVKVIPQCADPFPSDRIVVVSNPSSLCINKHLVAVANYDSLQELAGAELYRRPAKDDILLSCGQNERLAYHLVFQHSYMPCFPSALPVVWGPWLAMDVAPDVMLVHSSLAPFSCKVGRTTVVNIGSSPSLTHSVVSLENGPSYDVKTDAHESMS
ncbi:DNA polymerase alpha subunit B [Pancytospora philotis]|nr:DNA polymerase alpha subunit B [Pancytospora philotis]